MNKLVNLSALTSVALLSASATMHKDSAANLAVVEKITINAPAAKVWAKSS